MQISGDFVSLKTTSERHFGHAPKVQSPNDFMSAFKAETGNALSETNDLQVGAEALVQQMIINPDSVDVHDVMIAQQKAQISLELTKNVLNKAVQAYQSLTNMK